MPKIVIHAASGEFRDEQGHLLLEEVSHGWRDAGCPAPNDAAFSIVVIPNGTVSDQRIHKWNGSAVVAKSVAELAAYDAAKLSASAQATSRQKDVLATCALVVRARGITAWNNMTTPQKVAATLAEADVWKNIREFIDDKV